MLTSPIRLPQRDHAQACSDVAMIRATRLKQHNKLVLFSSVFQQHLRADLAHAIVRRLGLKQVVVGMTLRAHLVWRHQPRCSYYRLTVHQWLSQ